MKDTIDRLVTKALAQRSNRLDTFDRFIVSERARLVAGGLTAKEAREAIGDVLRGQMVPVVAK